MSDIGKTPAEIAWNRLSACYLPPETADVKAFRVEFLSAISGFSSEVLTDAVTQLIRTRKSKTFPSIGDVHETCMEQYPSTPHRPSMVESHHIDEARRAESLRVLAETPGIDRVIEQGLHVMGLEFVMREGRLPFREEWLSMQSDVLRANELMREADSPPDDWTEFRVYITQTAAGALRYRRQKVADEINALRRKEAAE